MPRRVAFISSPEFLTHQTGLGHPESPQRLAAIWEAVADGGLTERLLWLDPRAATAAEVCGVHERAYVDLVRREVAAGRAMLSTGDTNVGPGSYAAALLAAGAGLAAVDAVCAGDADSAFCAVRPPGHHATASRGMGFCVFNNVAVAARYAQRARGVRRVGIVDWDLHHGNGTQAIFYDDPTVFYFSIHQAGNYPMPLTGLGHAAETGAGAGEGTNVNCPVPPGAGDGEFLSAVEGRLAPAMGAFAPDLVLISAGFDCRRGDPLGRLDVTDAGFARLTEAVMAIADATAGGRIISFLEGGYSLTGLASAAVAHLEALLG